MSIAVDTAITSGYDDLPPRPSIPGVDFHAIDGTMDTEDEIDRLVAALHLGLPRVVAEV